MLASGTPQRMVWLIGLGLAILAGYVQSSVGAKTPAVPSHRVEHTSGPIRIDGVLDEFDWMMAERIHFTKFSHDPEDHKPLRDNTDVAALWDEEDLYLAFIIRDREIWAESRQRDARLWPEECVEFFLDPDGDGRQYIEVQLNSLNNIRDILVDGSIANPSSAQFDEMARWNFRRLRSAVKVYGNSTGHDLGWTLEIAIPWSDLDFARRAFPPKPGDEIRMNFYRFERSRRGQLPLELSGWSPVHGDFHAPSRFGRIVFAPPAPHEGS